MEEVWRLLVPDASVPDAKASGYTNASPELPAFAGNVALVGLATKVASSGEAGCSPTLKRREHRKRM